MDGVMFAVDRKNGTPRATRRCRHERAGHDEHFLVRQRDRLPGVDRREHRFERRRTGRGANDDVRLGMGGDGHETCRAVRFAKRGGLHPEFRGLFSKAIRIRSRCKCDHPQFVRMSAHDVQRALTDGTRRAKDGKVLQKLYLANT